MLGLRQYNVEGTCVLGVNVSHGPSWHPRQKGVYSILVMDAGTGSDTRSDEIYIYMQKTVL